MPGETEVDEAAFNIVPPADCPPVHELEWRGKVYCNDAGGYSIDLTADAVIMFDVYFASGGGGLLECTQIDLTKWTCLYEPPDPPEPEATVQICPEGMPCKTYHFPLPAEPCGTTGKPTLELDSYGCDPATGKFFCILDVALPGVVSSDYWVKTNISMLGCTVISTPPDRIYCSSGWNPGITKIYFAETNPSIDYSAEWLIAPEACPTEPPPPPPPQCSDFTTQPTCDAQWMHGCKWMSTYCGGTYH